MPKRPRYEDDIETEDRAAASEALTALGLDAANEKVCAWVETFIARKLEVTRERVKLRRAASAGEGHVSQVVRNLVPLIERAREDIFRSGRPPFSSLPQAAKWIDSHADPTVGEALLDELERLDPPTVLDVTLHPHTLRFYASRDTRTIRAVHVNPLDHNNLITVLSEHAQLIEAQTGWTQPDVVALLMTGRRPKGSMRAEVEWTPRGGVPRLRLTLWPWHVRAWAAFLRSGIRQEDLRRFDWEMLPEETAQLLMLMDRVGYPSKDRQQPGYWVQIASAWKQEYGMPPAPDALRVRWNRLPRKVRNSLRSREHRGDSREMEVRRESVDVPRPGHRWRAEGQPGSRLGSRSVSG